MVLKNSIYILVVTISLSSIAQTRIVPTAALTNAHYSFRKKQYLASFNALFKLGYRKNSFYIVEALKKHGPTFLNEHCNHVFYSKANNSSFRNHGINEALTFYDALNHFKFDDDDMIIKMTGRYLLLSDSFFIIAKNNSHYDAIVKQLDPTCFYTSLIAMKCKHWKKMIEEMNLEKMDKEYIALEMVVKSYIDHHNLNTLYVDNLGLKAHFYGSSSSTGYLHWNVVDYQ